MRLPPNDRSRPSTLADRILDEGAMPIVVAAREEGIRCSPKTAIRWALVGAHGVRLETIRVGGRRLTSREALRRFVAAQQQDHPPAAATLDARAAEAVLRAHGLGAKGGP